MPTTNAAVIGGVDCHADTHHAVALDGCGRRLGDAQFPATAAGDQALLAWLRAFGPVTMVGVESTSAYGAGLTRHLLAGSVRVVEVNQPHPHARRRRGKTDPLDAEAAAHKALSGEATTVPKDTTGIVEAIRLLRVARAGTVKAHTAALNQLGELLLTAPEPCAASSPASARPCPAGFRSVLGCGRTRPGSLTRSRLPSWPSARSPNAPNSWTGRPATWTGWARRPRSRTCAPPIRSRPPRARPPLTGSTPAVTATPTPRYT
jgi:hypothetical protein